MHLPQSYPAMHTPPTCIFLSFIKLYIPHLTHLPHFYPAMHTPPNCTLSDVPVPFSLMFPFLSSFYSQGSVCCHCSLWCTIIYSIITLLLSHFPPQCHYPPVTSHPSVIILLSLSTPVSLSSCHYPLSVTIHPSVIILLSLSAPVSLSSCHYPPL